MTVSYDVVFVKKPASEGQVLELLRKIEVDEAQIERITADYERVGMTPEKDPTYQEVADRIQNAFSLAEDLAAELGSDESESDDHYTGELKAPGRYSGPVRLNGTDMAIKSQDPEFIEWSREQLALAELGIDEL